MKLPEPTHILLGTFQQLLEPAIQKHPFWKDSTIKIGAIYTTHYQQIVGITITNPQGNSFSLTETTIELGHDWLGRWLRDMHEQGHLESYPHQLIQGIKHVNQPNFNQCNDKEKRKRIVKILNEAAEVVSLTKINSLGNHPYFGSIRDEELAQELELENRHNLNTRKWKGVLKPFSRGKIEPCYFETEFNVHKNEYIVRPFILNPKGKRVYEGPGVIILPDMLKEQLHALLTKEMERVSIPQKLLETELQPFSKKLVHPIKTKEPYLRSFPLLIQHTEEGVTETLEIQSTEDLSCGTAENATTWKFQRISPEKPFRLVELKLETEKTIQSEVAKHPLATPFWKSQIVLSLGNHKLRKRLRAFAKEWDLKKRAKTRKPGQPKITKLNLDSVPGKLAVSEFSKTQAYFRDIVQVAETIDTSVLNKVARYLKTLPAHEPRRSLIQTIQYRRA